jgi:hypothetical protein
MHDFASQKIWKINIPSPRSSANHRAKKHNKKKEKNRKAGERDQLRLCFVYMPHPCFEAPSSHPTLDIPFGATPMQLASQERHSQPIPVLYEMVAVYCSYIVFFLFLVVQAAASAR